MFGKEEFESFLSISRSLFFLLFFSICVACLSVIFSRIFRKRIPFSTTFRRSSSMFRSLLPFNFSSTSGYYLLCSISSSRLVSPPFTYRSVLLISGFVYLCIPVSIVFVFFPRYKVSELYLAMSYSRKHLQRIVGRSRIPHHTPLPPKPSV